MIDSQFKTPYNIIANFGVQQQFAGGFVLKLSYAGRFGRRLLGQADANQVIDNADPKSSQLLSAAMTNATLAARACAGVAKCLANLAPQPWFENVTGPGLEATFGPPTAYGVANWTSFLAYELGTLISNGDFADTVQAAVGGYSSDQPYNAGMSPQFSQDTVYTNKGFSEYNGMLVTLHKNMTHGLSFDANYTWAHSIDNVSLYANTGASARLRIRLQRAPPAPVPRQLGLRRQPDLQQLGRLSAALRSRPPVGGLTCLAGPTRSSADGTSAPSSTCTPATPGAPSRTPSSPSYSNDAQAFYNGTGGDIHANITKNSAGQVNIFSKGTATASEFSGPLGFAIGPRNNLRGPGFFLMDSGLDKTFDISRDKNINLIFRADFYNVLNHPNFSTPLAPASNTDITNSNFGVITTTTGPIANQNARIGQLALRLEF